MMTATRDELGLERPGRFDTFLERLADKVGANAGAAMVYAAPVERDGVTVIPVGKVRWGFGGGFGEAQKEASTGGGTGGGAGGGVMVSPVGYIELAHGETRFRPIVDPIIRIPMVI